MHKFLNRVGVSDRVLKLIPQVVDTCKVCRTWQKPTHASSATVSLPDTFNEQVECDLLFIHKHIIFHLVDRCTRWHAAKLVPNKEADTMLQAINEAWISVHGPMKELITDGESGITQSSTTLEALSRLGVKLHHPITLSTD